MSLKIRLYGNMVVHGSAASLKKKEADEPYVKGSVPELSKNGFRGFLQDTMLSDCLENSVNCN
ncbi:MAG: hypothetical protein ACYSWZ_06035 [Planctomycetota bacterium]|jgi:hypothetical protein